MSFEPDFAAERHLHRIHPFAIEHPADYHYLDGPDFPPDMVPFDCFEFYFDNGWGASVLDARNEGFDPGQRWILDFGAWETRQGTKVLHQGRHRHIDDSLCVTSITTDEVTKYLHDICRFEERTFSASKISTCYSCNKYIRRTQDIIWDYRNRPYHAACR